MGLLHRASSELISQQNMCYFLATKMLLVSGEVGKGQGVLFWKRGSITWNIVTGIAIFLLLSNSKSRTERCVRKTKREIMTVSLLGNITGGLMGGLVQSWVLIWCVWGGEYLTVFDRCMFLFLFTFTHSLFSICWWWWWYWLPGSMKCKRTFLCKSP